MADKSPIEWTEATWNPVTGCTLVSEGCRHCYAARLAATRLKHIPSRKGLARLNAAGEAKFTGELRFNEEWLTQPLRWKRPRMIFVCAHGDLFHENVPDEWIDRIFAVMALPFLVSPSGQRPSTPLAMHTYQVLTKRSARMRKYLTDAGQDVAPYDRSAGDGQSRLGTKDRILLQAIILARKLGLEIVPSGFQWPLANVWLGVSAEDQATADERIPDLLATPAAIRFVSAEPLLRPIDFTRSENEAERICRSRIEASTGVRQTRPSHLQKLDWVIVGGESGDRARPMHPDWPRAIRDQCKAAGVAFFFKQWGSHSIVYDRDVEDPDWRRCNTIQQAHPAGRWLNLAGGHGFHGERVVYAVPTTKKQAGRLLDGVEHNAMPSPAAGQAPDRAPGDIARPAGALAAREAQK